MLRTMDLSKAAAALGRKGGEAKVPKGFAKMDPVRQKKIAKAAIRKRWKLQKERDGTTDAKRSSGKNRNSGGNAK